MQGDPKTTGWQAAVLVFVVGLFGLVAQTLLARFFLTVFEGNELGLACFFGSWLTWVMAGALAARANGAAVRALARRFEWLPLLYVPAFVLQWWLIGRARELTGVQRYEMFPLFTMLPATFAANAPVSFCTGLLFTLACRWLRAARRLPVASVYTWECAGGFTGGLAVTVLLSAGVAPETLFGWTALLTALAVAVCGGVRGRRAWPAVLPALAVAAALAGGVPARWERHNNLRTWQRLLPARAYDGRFTTPEATYLYGVVDGQFNVVARETITDSLPAAAHASEVIALHLAQRPDARRFLVAGPGAAAISRRLLELPQADTVTWLDPDPAYPSRLKRVLPAGLTAGLERVRTPAQDIRRWLVAGGGDGQPLDLVILNLPDATTLSLNRYFTRECFELVRQRLAPGGAVGVRVTAGENFMSRERINAGASVFHTLLSVFGHLVIKPGEESWLIASDGPGLSEAPAELRERWAAIPGADRLYPPAGLLSLYLPQRGRDQRAAYEQAIRGETGKLLMNTRRFPRALLHGLLFAAREAGAGDALGGLIRTFALRGWLVAPAGLALWALLRAVFLLRGGPSPPAARPLDGYALVFTTGAAGMAGSIVLMYLYQAAFGSLFLHVGLLSALYMLGLAAGSGLCTRRLARSPRPPGRWPTAVLLCHAGCYGALALWRAQIGYAGFAAAFLLNGLLAGVYVPVAAARLRAAGVAPGAAGAAVETADHFGGAVGGLLGGLVFLPLFGTAYGFVLPALLLLSNLGGLLAEARSGARRDRAAARADVRGARAAAYALFGLCVFVPASGLLLRGGGAGADGGQRAAFEAFARTAAGARTWREHRATLKAGAQLSYLAAAAAAARTADGERLGPAYAFSTATLAPGIDGYGGPLALAVAVGADGALERVEILPSRETPAYTDGLRSWLAQLRGRNLFAAEPLPDVDAVTGATLTSAAVLRILRTAGPAFASGVLGRPAGAAARAAPRARAPWPAGPWLAAAAAVAVLVLRRYPSRPWRRAWLLVVLAVFGLRLNAQYSLAHVFALIGFRLPPAGWSAAFVLAVGVPLAVACLGNVYCGYLCPFGALQELVGDLRPGRVRSDPDKTAWGRVRLVKYGALAVCVLLFGATLRQGLASEDPLVTVFARQRSAFVLWGAVVAAGLSWFFPRLWCRCLCPAGAFLALLNGVRLARPPAPAVAPRACSFGVRDRRELDCLCCDRCRRPGRREIEALQRPAGWKAPAAVNALLTLCALALALAVAVHGVSTWKRGRREVPGAGTARPAGRGGRAVDMKRLRALIDQGRLSEKEARYYGTPSGEPLPP